MYYFVPSWYNQQRTWYDSTQPWFYATEEISFDDTINQLRMFLANQEKAKVLVLNYQPQLRYFLHKQDLTNLAYWSFFDDIQNITDTTTQTLNFKDFEWPEGTSFIYTPYSVVARLANRVLATIHFADNGNLFYIEFLRENESVEKRYIFDDRGFLSSILYFNEYGEQAYQDYLNKRGVWQLRELLQGNQTQTILVNPLIYSRFQKTSYQSWEEIIRERLSIFESNYLKVGDSVTIASDFKHNHLLLEVFARHPKILSFFGNRYSVSEHQSDVAFLARKSSFFITESEQTELKLRQLVPSLSFSIILLSPFDTRLRLGHSQFLENQEIYFFIDNLEEKELRRYLMILLIFLENEDKMLLRLVSFKKSQDWKNMESWLLASIREHFQESKFFAPEPSDNGFTTASGRMLTKLVLNCLTNENDIIEILDSARLVIDLGDIPNLYTQIAAISAGIPQINCVRTEYVSHRQNGLIIEAREELASAIGFYLKDLANWNQSLVYAVQKMSEYTSGNYMEHWKILTQYDRRDL